MAAPLGDPKSEHISIVGPAPGRSTDIQIRNQVVRDFSLFAGFFRSQPLAGRSLISYVGSAPSTERD